MHSVFTSATQEASQLPFEAQHEAFLLHTFFTQLSHAVNPRLVQFQHTVPIRLAASDCSTQLFETPASDCDKARDFLTTAGLSYEIEPMTTSGGLVTHIGTQRLAGFDAAAWRRALADAGYPASTDVTQIDRPRMYVLLALLMIWGAIFFTGIRLLPSCGASSSKLARAAFAVLQDVSDQVIRFGVGAQAVSERLAAESVFSVNAAACNALETAAGTPVV